MKVERDLHMIQGNGVTSYAANSRLQEKAILETKPLVEKAIREVYMSFFSDQRMVVADLGCSSGPNTLLVMSEMIGAISDLCQKLGHRQTEVQFFLNDLPGNDFNLVFQSLEHFDKMLAKERGVLEWLPAYYIAGLPGSFYTRLFPCQSVHLFHSSYSLMWLSQVPEELESKRETHMNEGNIYIGKTTPLSVVRCYQKQFQKDFSLYLRLRAKELVLGGQMVLTLLGRKSTDISNGEMSNLWGLLAQALNSMALEGLVVKEKIDTFNLPFYAPSIEEVQATVKRDKLFGVKHVEILTCNWDPFDDSDDDFVTDHVQSGANVAKCIRAVTESLIARHFGEDILDDLFARYARNVAKHLSKEKTKYAVIVLALRTRH